MTFHVKRLALAAALIVAVASIDYASAAPSGFRIKAMQKKAPTSQQSPAAIPIEFTQDDQEGGEGNRTLVEGPNQEQYDNRAFPQTYIAAQQQLAAYLAFQSIGKLPGGKKTNWQELGPINPLVAGPWTYTGRTTTDSGRVTALALSPQCHGNDCKIFVAAAGGGVWQADNALAQQPNWTPTGSGIPSNAIGSIIFDPTDTKGKTLYVGTGEPNGSSDSEAGVGLYKSTDFGASWALVPGSLAVAIDRSIAAIAVDPSNSNHLFIGTAVARHGSSSVNGGRFTPPDAPVIGVYESTDGGATFALVFSRAADVVNPGSPTGDDFFRGGISKISYAPDGRLYVSVFDYGLYRSTAGGGFEQVFASAGGGLVANSLSARTEFSLAPLPNGNLRIYVGDTGSGIADFYRVDNANVAASTLTNGVTNPGWIKLSSSTDGTPGFSSYNYCGGQCSYDMPVYSPPGAPDIVYIGGQMQYDEIFTSTPPSNGRTVQRSADAGVHFTDMTNDTLSPPLGMHPDQHAMVAVPGNPNVVFFGSDGGVVRIDGSFANASADCANRGISGSDLIDCQAWLAAIPTQIISLNRGLATLQFQSLSINVQDPLNDIMGGTQDNGTWAYNGQGQGSWFESAGGDGGQSGIDVGNPNIRMHTFSGAQGDVNFHGTDPLGWNWMADRFNEAASFYFPVINDPRVSGTWFAGLGHVWRTKDNGGSQAFLEQYCNEFFGDYGNRPQPCGDWVTLGGAAGNLIAGSAADKGTGYVVAITRASQDSATMWVGTRRGRVFLSKNADAADPNAVTYTRLDTAAQPRRFVSGIAIDPTNANHAFISFSGYNAYTPTTPGHVFEATYNPATAATTWVDLSYNLGDLPITGLARDNVTGDLYASTDFGVAMLASGASTWVTAAGSLPPVAVYGLTIDSNARVLYAATHGRGAWRLDLSK